jgi:hypothetical protein
LALSVKSIQSINDLFGGWSLGGVFTTTFLGELEKLHWALLYLLVEFILGIAKHLWCYPKH